MEIRVSAQKSIGAFTLAADFTVTGDQVGIFNLDLTLRLCGETCHERSFPNGSSGDAQWRTPPLAP